jgi:hypothetical protein
MYHQDLRFTTTSTAITTNSTTTIAATATFLNELSQLSIHFAHPTLRKSSKMNKSYIKKYES